MMYRWALLHHGEAKKVGLSCRGALSGYVTPRASAVCFPLFALHAHSTQTVLSANKWVDSPLTAPTHQHTLAAASQPCICRGFGEKEGRIKTSPQSRRGVSRHHALRLHSKLLPRDMTPECTFSCHEHATRQPTPTIALKHRQ